MFLQKKTRAYFLESTNFLKPTSLTSSAQYYTTTLVFQAEILYFQFLFPVWLPEKKEREKKGKCKPFLQRERGREITFFNLWVSFHFLAVLLSILFVSPKAIGRV